MHALLPIILTASHVLLAADSVPKFDVERTCRPAAEAAVLPGRDSAACQRDERDARVKLERDWARYNAAQKRQCAGFAASRTELRGVAYLPGTCKTNPGTATRFESRNCWPPVIIRTSFPGDCCRGWRTNPASATACMQTAAWACPSRPSVSFFPYLNASDLSP